MYGACVKKLQTDERAAAAGCDKEWSKARDKAVRRAERAQEDPERATLEREAGARRKRARRIEDGKEDRDALRELASTRDCDALPLEATPAGLREAALDGTPRSAKAAGAQLRVLTQSFLMRLTDPRFYGFEHGELEAVSVPTEVWDNASGRNLGHHQHYVQASRPLKIFQGKPGTRKNPGRDHLRIAS